MKCNILVFFSIAVIFLSIFSIAPQAHAGLILGAPKYIGLNSGLVGYWSFNGADMANVTAYDRSGNSNNGTLTNGPTRAAGKLGQALNFDGTNDYVAVGDVTALKITGALSISFWVNGNTANPTGDSKQLVGKYDSVNPQRGYIVYQPNTIGSRKIRFGYQRSASVYNAGDEVTSAQDVLNGSWHFVTAVFSPSASASIYIDGVQDAQDTTDIQATIANNTTPFEIGRAEVGGISNVYVTAQIDDVRIYNRALSAEEIRRLYRIGGTLKVNTQINNDSIKNGLVGYWSFDGKDMANVIAYDRSGQDNDGILTSGPISTMGKIGQALSFDGSDDYINLGTPAELNFSAGSPWTFSHWINWKGDATKNYTFYAGKTSAVKPNILLRTFTEIDSNPYHFAFRDGNPTSIYHDLGDSSNYINKWTYLTWAADSANNVTLYINGQYASTTNVVSSAIQFVGIGRGYSSSIYNMTGFLDDVRIYNRALSRDEIKRLYRIGATLKVNTSINNDSLAKGLVGYWSFDGKDMADNGIILTSYDRSGQNNHGSSTVGTTAPTKTIGKIGQGLRNSQGKYVELDAAVVTGTPFSACVWFYHEGGDDTLIFIGDKDVTNQLHRVQVRSNSQVQVRSLNGATIGTAISITTYSPNTWNHACGVWTSSTLRTVYLNGKNEGSNTTNVTPVGLDRTTIGRNGDSTPDDYFTGIIDDVRIYNRALSGDEIKRLYNLGR